MLFSSKFYDSSSVTDDFRSVTDDFRSVTDDFRSVTDNSRMTLQLVTTFTIAIYDRQIFIVQGTGCNAPVRLSWKNGFVAKCY
jgi:hypothetical protein